MTRFLSSRTSGRGRRGGICRYYRCVGRPRVGEKTDAHGEQSGGLCHFRHGETARLGVIKVLWGLGDSRDKEAHKIAICIGSARARRLLRSDSAKSE